MGAGICAMHYTGMAALDMAPGIVWNPLLVAASALIAVGASAAALLIFFWLRKVSGDTRAALPGARRTGDGSSHLRHALHRHDRRSFPADAVCLSADSLAGNEPRRAGGAVVACASDA